MSCVFRGPIFLGLICALVSSVALRGEQKVSFELRDGDRVAFLGNSFFERARHHGYLETSLALRWPERRITFRNLGWDGDTVFGHSRTGGRRRSIFGDPEEGFGKMIAHLRQLDPTVIFIAYGWNESFAGLQGIAPFRAGLTRLLQNAGAPTRRFVLLTPVPLEQGFGTELSSPRRTDPPPTTYLAGRNTILKSYRDAIVSVATEGGHHLVDLFEALQQSKRSCTANGIHPSAEGYQDIALIMARSLRLPDPAIALDSPEAGMLRSAIVRKNALYFHRWRPRNDAFVYGERKQEQVTAQGEPEQFEPFVTKQEKHIREQLEALR